MTQSELSYSFRGRPFAAETTLDLREKDLVAWQASKKFVIPYADIEAVRLFFRPRGINLTGYKTKIYCRGGKTVTLEDRTWKSLVEAEQLGGQYRAFVTALCARVAQANGNVLFYAGRSRWILAIAGLLGAAMTALLFYLGGRAVFSGQWLTSLAILGFASLFGWWSLQYVTRNLPGFFMAASIPERVLPSA